MLHDALAPVGFTPRRLGLSSGTLGRLDALDATKAGIVRLSRRTQRLLRPERSPSES